MRKIILDKRYFYFKVKVLGSSRFSFIKLKNRVDILGINPGTMTKNNLFFGDETDTGILIMPCRLIS